MQFARDISGNGPLAVRAAKQMVSPVTVFQFETGLDFYESLLHSKDRLEALEAFKVKRLSQFKGG